MLGAETAPLMKLKGAEPRWHLEFVCDVLARHKLKVENGQMLEDAGRAIIRFQHLLDTSPRALPGT
eukprot:566448-Alexandrium_andersonii.AAC.1